MKKRMPRSRATWLTLVALGLISGCQLAGASEVPMVSGSYAPGELLVQFKPGTSSDAALRVHLAVGATVVGEPTSGGLYRVSVGAGHEREEMARYQAEASVAYVEVNRPLQNQMVGGFRMLGDRRVMTALPNDPLYLPNPPGPDGTPRLGLPGQWGIEAMRVRDAWDKTTGSSTIKVAVLDTGVDSGHPDLQGSLDMADAQNFMEPGSPPDDDFGHGTHVAGVIAAQANNGVGIAGVAPACQVMPVRVLSVEGGTTFSLIQGISWAVRHGARVLNMSLGSNQYSRAEEDAIQAALARGVVVVAAAGNEALTGNPLSYPGAIDGVICVAAVKRDTDANGNTAGYERAEFSNFNPFVTVAAPGVDILSTVPRRFTSNGAAPDAPYAYASGTSQATPMVSGVVALMLSAHPNWGPAEVRAALRSSGLNLDPSGQDPNARIKYGSGLVQAPGAIQ